MAEKSDDWLDIARKAMSDEAAAISAASERLGEAFNEAVRAILNARSKLIVCGIGKSGWIGHKLAATFSSCGVPSVFLHAAEAIHGDLGVYQPGDPTLLLSKSGSTAEVLRLMPMFRKLKSPVIAIVGNMDSPIAQAADVVLDASVKAEADPLGLMPTSSSTVSLAIGDALASALVKARGFTAEQFATFHPGGQLGRNLLLTVGDVMHLRENVACNSPDDTMRDAVIGMNRHPLGATCVVEGDDRLAGILTDGDLRRSLSEPSGEILDRPVSEFMTQSPISVHAEMVLGEAVRIMEDRASQISVLPVVADDNRLVGLLRLHDAYQPHLA